MSGETIERQPAGALLTGATGLVGGRLLPALAARHVWVRTLSRSGAQPAGADRVDARAWDGVDPGTASLDGVGTVVHLAGEPIFGGLPSRSRLSRVRSSRVDSTQRLVERIAERPPRERPRTLICASAVGFYGDAGEARLNESAPVGRGFLAEVCRDWEAAAEGAVELGVRVVRLRIGVVLSREGGALALMRLPFSLGLGGRLGSGKQFFPWIHLDDLVDAIAFCLDHTSISGAVNAVAPEFVRNADLTRALGDVLGRPTFLPVPGLAVRAVLGEVAGELLGSRCVDPGRLVAEGFSFQHPTLRSAIEAELG